ncbi:hypothetical protein CCHL11_02154 [Colletotrichum chlorophyti]|uniref:Uncharacterized protein n=1 Tax=Colletotrichum chlorophyti TaxID=708187 RepID=A0A1Q8S708_9PEZI|nr:hypothetical protein CCHL11_02154 [Colletotrichum chlorophyti]
MRPTQPASALVALLFAAAASALTPAKLHCLRSRNLELARLAACGEPGSVAHCLNMLTDDFTQSDLEACYIHAGCDVAEAIVESQWTLDRCDDGGHMAAELRKRHVPIFARQTTAEAAPTETATPTATGTGSSKSTLVCSTTTTKSTTLCPVVSTGVRKGQTLKDGCYPTQTVFATCAAGLLCKDDKSGAPQCLKLDNNIYAGGVAVALFFAVAITGTIGIITYLCCRERKHKKRIAAAAIAREAAANTKRPPPIEVHHADSQPFATQGQPPAGAGYHDGQDPFGDRNRM